MADTLEPSTLTDVLNVGQTVLFFPDPAKDHRDSRKARVQGWRPGQFILLDMVLENHRSILLRQGSPSSVRFVHGGRIHAFSTTALDSRADQREPGIRVAWPESINVLQLRKHQRVSVSIKAHLKNEQVECDGVIDDISLGGVRIVVPVAMENGAQFDCSFSLPDGAEFSGITCEVKNAERQRENVVLGCAFVNLDDKGREDIDFFIAMAVASARADTNPERILFMGSDFKSIQPLLERLRTEGFIVATATGAIEGFAKLRSIRPTVLFVASKQVDLAADLVYRTIRQTQAFETLPILTYGGAELSVAGQGRPEIEGHIPSMADSENVLREIERVLKG